MVRESVVHLVLFVAVIAIATVSVGMLVAETSLYAGSVTDEADRETAEIDAEIEIVNDAPAGTTHDEDDGTVTLYVKNVGGATLEPERIDVLLDGEYVATRSVRVIDDDHWRPGRVLEVTLDRNLATGDHRAVVAIDGARDFLEFEHRIAYWLDPSGEPATSDCDAGSCTVDGGKTDALNLTMATDPVQETESVAYAVDDTRVATVDPDSGVTDAAGENGTTLELLTDGVVNVSLDTGWDEDVVTITVVNATDEWLQFGYDDRNTGYQTETFGPTANLVERWSTAADDGIRSSTAVDGDTVYVGTDNGTLAAVDRTSGDLRWEFHADGALSASPTVVGDVVYVGSEGGTVYAVDAAAGTERWNASVADPVTDSSPTVADDVLYTGTDGGAVYALNATDGAEVWNETPSGTDPIRATPAVANGTVFVGSTDGFVYALNGSEGTREWATDTGDVVDGTPAVADGTVFVGNGNGTVSALATADGGTVWEHEANGSVESSPAVAEGVVYVADGAGELTAIDAGTGDELWWYASDETAAEFPGSPAVVDGQVYVVESDTDGQLAETSLLVVDGTTGSETASLAFTGELVTASPAVVDNHVFVADDAGTIYALTEDE